MEQLQSAPADVQVAFLRSLPREELTRTLYGLEPADLATLFTRVGDEILAELVAELDPFDAAHIIGSLSRAQAAQVLEEMDPDEAADVVGELEREEAEEILTVMGAAEARDLRELLEYPPDSAGGLMSRDFVALSPNITAGRALTILREMTDAEKRVPYFYIVDPATRRLAGVLSLRNLILSPPSTLLRDLLVRRTIKVQASADREEAARLIDQFHLRALPVVDGEDRLLGTISAEDAAEVLLREAHEDIERLGGSQPLDEPYLRTSPIHLLLRRIPWLMFLFVAGAFTANVVQAYEATISAQIALAVFMPLLIGIGGNTGSQITTTLVRALSTGEVTPGDALQVLWKEVRVALLVGVFMSAAAVVRAWSLDLDLGIARVVGITALCVVLWAAVVAAVLPLLLRRLRLDPAVISAPFITTLVDGTGLLIYFTIARSLLDLA